MKPHADLARITQRIIKRSVGTRARYLAHIAKAVDERPARSRLGCTNFAHGQAAFPLHDKLVLNDARQANIAIVSAYNDMLSAHQPYERFPEIIKGAVREVGAVAQFAGGVPAMCDG